MDQAVCADDFGDAVVQCRYTKVLLWPDDAVAHGATMPGVKARYFMASTPEARSAHKQAGIWFHESEANCNTCRFLDRVKRSKNAAGFLYGKCAGTAPRYEVSPYASRQEGDVMVFHPDDAMHMPCYVSRWSQH